MESLFVEVVALGFNRTPGIGQAVEQFQVQTFIPQAAIEAFVDPVLPRLARLDVGRLDLLLGQPLLDRRGNELRAVVASQIAGTTMPQEQTLQNFDHLGRRDRIIHVRFQAFPCELVHYCQNPQLAPIAAEGKRGQALDVGGKGVLTSSFLATKPSWPPGAQRVRTTDQEEKRRFRGE